VGGLSMVIRFGLCFFLTAVVVACGGSGITTTSRTAANAVLQPAGALGTALQPPVLLTTAQAGALISPSVSSSTRAFLSSFLMQRRFRQNELGSSYKDTTLVIYDARTKSLYANRTDVAALLPKKTTAVPASNAALTGARRDIVDAISTTTGPSRRVWTTERAYPVDPGQYGNIFSEAYVSLPCGGNSIVGDQNQIYFGGDSGDQPLDAGLQYNYNNPPGNTSATWEPYFNFGYGVYLGSYQELNGTQWVPTTGTSIPCGQSANLEFYVSDYQGSGGLQTAFQLITSVSGQVQNYVYLAPSDPYNDWSGDCGGCSLKAATSIAQAPPQNLFNGDAFGPVTWGLVYLGCGFAVPADGCSGQEAWGSSQTQVCDEWPYWESTVSTGTGDCFNSPPGADVAVTSGNYADETVTITLPTPVAEATPPTGTPTSAPGFLQPNGTTKVPGLVWGTTYGYSNGELSTLFFLINQNSSPVPLYLSGGNCAVYLVSVIVNGVTDYSYTPSKCEDIIKPIDIAAGSIYEVGTTVAATINTSYGNTVVTTWDMNAGYRPELVGGSPSGDISDIAESHPVWSGNVLAATPSPTPTPTPTPAPTPTPTPKPVPTRTPGGPNCAKDPSLCAVKSRPTP